MNPLKRVRITFVALAELSIVVLISAIILSTVLTSNARIDSRADEVVRYIYDNPTRFGPDGDPGGFVPPFGSETGDQSFQAPDSMGSFEEPFPPDFPGGFTPGSADMLAGLRFFRVNFEGGSIANVELDYILAVSQEEASQIAIEIKNSGSQIGYYKNYRYGLFEREQFSSVIFLDWENQLEMGTIYRNNALIIAGAGIVLSFVILLFVSRFVTKPVEIANEKQKKFISDASHELKTPLAIISANDEILEMLYGEDEATNAIKKQVNKMTDTVRSMTTLAKLGEIARSEFTDVCLSDIATDVVGEFKPAFEKCEKKLTGNIAGGINLKGVEAELRKLISICLDNARKYAKSYCEVSLEKSGKGVVLKIRNDLHEDMEEGNKNEVFDRFYRTDDARASAVEGSGIGLSIAKEIALLHKAKISCYINSEKEFVIETDF